MCFCSLNKLQEEISSIYKIAISPLQKKTENILKFILKLTNEQSVKYVGILSSSLLKSKLVELGSQSTIIKTSKNLNFHYHVTFMTV